MAVSGGVDSVVLLDLLAGQPHLELIVAHFDHGIREDSSADAALVSQLAQRYGLQVVTERAELGPQASEESARKARYTFLRKVQRDERAHAIITAHHQDDVLETALINMLRGTGWRGLCSLRDTAEVRRPLLAVSKRELIAYAERHHLLWHEDSTNGDRRFLRNRVRHELLPKTDESFRQELLALIARQTEMRQEIEQLNHILLNQLSLATSDSFISLDRLRFTSLPNHVAKELLLTAAQQLTGRRVEQKMLARMLWFARTARLYKTLQVTNNIELYIEKRTVVVRGRRF